MRSVVVLIAWQVGESGPAFSQSRVAYVAHGPDAVCDAAEPDAPGAAEPDCGFLHAPTLTSAAARIHGGREPRRIRVQRFEYVMIFFAFPVTPLPR
jgi:hypothetical protein